MKAAQKKAIEAMQRTVLTQLFNVASAVSSDPSLLSEIVSSTAKLLSSSSSSSLSQSSTASAGNIIASTMSAALNLPDVGVSNMAVYTNSIDAIITTASINSSSALSSPGTPHDHHFLLSNHPYHNYH